jgi:hypothetical protein
MPEVTQEQREYLERLTKHWRTSADELFDLAEVNQEGCLQECDETAAIVLRDCASAVDRFLSGLPILVDLTPEEKLLQALKERQ